MKDIYICEEEFKDVIHWQVCQECEHKINCDDYYKYMCTLNCDSCPNLVCTDRGIPPQGYG